MLIALLISLVVVLIVAGGIYFWIHKSTPQPSSGEPPVRAMTVSATTSVEVSSPGTSTAIYTQYTDKDFGFSFWYPSAWTVQTQAPDASDSYQGGTVKKMIIVQIPPTSANEQSANSQIKIDEYYSADMTITFPGDDCPTVTCFNFQFPTRLYFDPSLRTWMIGYPEGQATSKGDTIPAGYTTPANVSDNTMGGLHIINGVVPYDSTGVIPLSAHNFLVISVPLSYDSIGMDAVVKTIMATDPAVATPVSPSEQSSTVQAEAAFYTSGI